MNDSSKKRGNIFTGNQQASYQSSASTKSLKINLSSSKNSFKSAKQNLEESKDSINSSVNKGNQQNNKYDQRVLNINLSQISNQTSNTSKRPNLFNEKSTSRERILTRKSGHNTNANSTQNSIKTPQFNLGPQSQQLKRNQPKKQEEILKDFPFLQIQKMNGLGINYKNLISTGMNDDLIEEEQEYDQQQKFTQSNQKESRNTLQSLESDLKQNNSLAAKQEPFTDFFNGIDVFSQSEVSRPTSVQQAVAINRQVAANESSINISIVQSSKPTQNKPQSKVVEVNFIGKKAIHKDLDLNLSDASQNQLQNNQRQGHKSPDKDDNESNQDDEFLSAIHDDEYMNQEDQGNFSYPLQQIMPELQISNIDVKNDYNQMTTDDMLLGGVNTQQFNRKEERLKNQINQHLLDKILYEQVIPREIRDLATNSILNFSAMNQSNQTKLSQTAHQLYDDVLLKGLLIKFLNEFLSVTDDTYESQKALKKYLEEVLIEDVNFNLCSEIWNDCLLLPHVMKEDPNLCLSGMIDDLIIEIAQEAIQNELKQDSYEEEEHQFQLETRTSEVNVNREIVQYVEENLIGEYVDNEIEEMVIQIMQEMIFMKKRVPMQIAEEIYNDLLRSQIRSNCQIIIKKERILSKGAESYLQMFMQQEIADIIIESQDNLKVNPDQLADELIDQVVHYLPKQMISTCCVKQEQDFLQNLVAENFLNSQLERLIFSLAQLSVNQNSGDNKILSRVNEGLIQETLSSMIPEVIMQAIDKEKNGQQMAKNLYSNAIDREIFNIANECVMEEIAQEEYDGIIDKIIEMDIWRGTVKELKQEEDAILLLVEEWTDNYTGEFFIDHFSEIKNEYLKVFKEEIGKLENSQQMKDMSILNISNTQNPFNNVNSALNSSQKLHEISASVNSSKFHDALSQNNEVKEYTIIKNKRKMDFQSRKQSNNSNQLLNNSSQFQSAASDVFYDCNNDNNNSHEDQDDDDQQYVQQFDQDDEDQEFINEQMLQNLSQQLYDEQQRKMLSGIEEYQEEYQEDESHSINQMFNHRNPRFDTQSEMLDETMQSLEIDEGIKKVNTIQNYYVVPEIKSLGFLNFQQKSFKYYFDQPCVYQTNTQYGTKKHNPTMLPIDALAIDVLCVNCYECVKFDYVDDHSNFCLKNPQSQLYDTAKINSNQSQNQIKTPYKNYFNDDHDSQIGFPVDLRSILKSDDLLSGQLDNNINLDNSYNFQEGRYILGENGKEEKAIKAQEEREFISEINERIFKLHKALKEKQIEEQTRISVNRVGSDMSLMRLLDDLESLAMNIFTNNTNKRELEICGSELIERINNFQPANGRELSISITARRLSQLTLEKIQSLVNYQQLMGIYKDDPNEVFSIMDGDNPSNITYQINNQDRDFSDYMPPRSMSQAPGDFQKNDFPQNIGPLTSNLVQDDYFKYLEEEQKHEKAELEIWRNLHNEILKNYLLTKAPLIGNRQQVHDINSDVSSKHDQFSDNTSTYSSNTGVSSVHGSQFQHHYRNNSVGTTPRDNNMQNSLSPRGLNTEEDNDVGKLNEVEESLKYKQTEDIKRHFYTLAIHNSKKILKSIPQGTVLKELYRKCLELRIPVADWEVFVQKELRNFRKQ